MKYNKIVKIIKPHRRKGSIKIVKKHTRTYYKRKSPRLGTLTALELNFESSPFPLNVNEISNYWKMHPGTVRRYLEVLERKGTIKRTIIHGKEHWEKFKKE